MRFGRLELGFRWSNNYVNILEHIPLGFLIGPGIFTYLSVTLLKLEYKHHSNEGECYMMVEHAMNHDFVVIRGRG